MDEFKIEHFERDNPGQSFPWFERVANSRDIGMRLLRRLGLPATTEGVAFLEALDERAQYTPAIDAEDDAFDLRRVLVTHRIPPPVNVLINWNHFEHVDRMRLDDLCRFFDDVWYPSADDIEIFDESCDWCVMVRHFGAVGVVDLR